DRAPRGLKFERADKSVSVSVEDYPANTIRFDKLYERLSTTKAPRLVTYRTLQPSYFVSSGKFRGRNFYTWYPERNLTQPDSHWLGKHPEMRSPSDLPFLWPTQWRQEFLLKSRNSLLLPMRRRLSRNQA